MYKITYEVHKFSHGEFDSFIAEFDDINLAIDKCIELFKERNFWESFEVVVNWELNDNV